jgi:hypothetical protein
MADDLHSGVPAPGPRRAKFVLDRLAVHAALGLPAGLRVVAMYVHLDPDELHVLVEGDAVPAAVADFGGEEDWGVAAAAGRVETQLLPHPYASGVYRAEFPGWSVGDPVPMPERAS